MADAILGFHYVFQYRKILHSRLSYIGVLIKVNLLNKSV